MGRTPDRADGVRLEEEILFDTNASPDGGPGSAHFDGTNFVMEGLDGQPYNPRDASIGANEDFTKASHGFAVGDVVRHAGPNPEDWVKAQADTAANARALGVVDFVDGNDFRIVYAGRIDGLSGLTAQAVHFLSSVTAGLLTTSEPGISRPVLFATSTTSGVVQLGRELGAAGTGDVTGPGSSTDHAAVRFDGATGKIIQNSGVIISDNDEVRNAGTVEWDKGADIASAATLTLGIDGNYFDVTGTTGVTAVSSKPVGTRILLQFDGIVTVTHNATTLILKGGDNFTSEAGDHLELISYDGTNWREASRNVGTEPTTGQSTGRENRVMLGNLLNYPLQGQVVSNSDIQYTQIFLRTGDEISDIETYISAGSGNGIRLGLYDQSDETDFAGTPDARVAQTDAYTVLIGDVGTFIDRPLTATYEVTETGYYWLALICDGKTVKFASTNTFREDYLPYRIESGTGTTLPATTGTITSPQGSVLYVSGVLD